MQPKAHFLLKQQISKFCEVDSRLCNVLEHLFTDTMLGEKEFFEIEGEKAQKFGFLISGCLRSFKTYETGKELLTDFLLPGDFIVAAVNFGENNLVTIQTIKNCEILVADYQKLEKLAEKEKEVFNFKKNLTSKLIKEKIERENNKANLDASDRYNIFLKKYPNLLNQIPHYYVASYLGISSTQLSRIRKKISLS